MRNCNAKNKQRSRNQRSRSPLAQVAWLGLLLWALAPALWAQTPGTPFLSSYPGARTLRNRASGYFYRKRSRHGNLSDEVVLINKANYPSYPTAPVAPAWSYKFENITCTAPFNVPPLPSPSIVSGSTNTNWASCNTYIFSYPTAAGSSAVQAMRDEDGAGTPSAAFRVQ
jgi:hypothetical protein